MIEYRLQEYLTSNGKSPFNEWLLALRDIRARARVRTRLDRASLGNLGDYSPVGEGVSELRIFYGPGYRAYYSLERNNVMLLLTGGTKDTQHRDIQTAKVYLADYRRRENGE